MSVFGADVAGVEIATVTDNNDPSQMGRLQVSFPADPSIPTSWARVLQPMAGSNYGVYILPEIGDQVLVAFAQNNHSIPVVMGSFYNAGQGYCADPDNYIKNIKTKAGNEIRLYDKPGEEAITITNTENGNKIELNMKDKSITITSPLKIEMTAPEIDLTGGIINITGGDISIKAVHEQMIVDGHSYISQKNIAIQADNKLSLEGTAELFATGQKAGYSGGSTVLNSDQDMKITATSSLAASAGTTADIKANMQMKVESSGQTAIKGAIVMIN